MGSQAQFFFSNANIRKAFNFKKFLLQETVNL